MKDALDIKPVVANAFEHIWLFETIIPVKRLDGATYICFEDIHSYRRMLLFDPV